MTERNGADDARPEPPTDPNRAADRPDGRDTLSEDEEQRISDSVLLAFDRFTHLRYQKLFAGLLEEEGGADAVAVEDSFLKVRATDIDSYMRVFDMRVKSKTAAKHEKVLIKAAVLSLISGDFALPELGRGLSRDASDDDASYTDRHMQRLLRGTYGDMFFESRRGLADGRIKRVSGPFSEKGPTPDSIGDQTRAYLDWAYDCLSARHGGDRERLALHSVMRFAFPQFLEDLARFRDMCRDIFENLGRRDSRIDFLRDNLVDNPLLLIPLHSHLISILDLAWFRAKPKDEKRTLLRRAPKVRYVQGDAKKAREILVRMYGRAHTYHTLSISGVAFLKCGRPSAAAHIFVECARVAESDMERGTAWQNVAVAYSADKHFKLALGAEKKALKCYESAGNAYKVCNALQIIGENQWRLGFRDAAMKSFGEVERRSMGWETDRWVGPFILGMSFGRLGETRLYRKYMTKSLTLIPEDDTERILHVNYMIDHPPTSADIKLPPALVKDINDMISRMDGVRRQNTWLVGWEDRVGVRGSDA